MPRRGDKDISKYIIKNCEECNKQFESRIKERKRFCNIKCSSRNTSKKNIGRKITEKARKNLSKSIREYLKRISKHPNLGRKFTKEQLAAHKIYTTRGEKHYKWKGGKTITGNGYVTIIDRSHPHANRHGQVFEHRIVMEKHLGRILKKTERVHHINKIKTDNRIENLILFKNMGDHIHWHMENDLGFKERTRRYHRLP